MNSKTIKAKNKMKTGNKKLQSTQKLQKNLTGKCGKRAMPIYPMLPRNYTMKERETLKVFERHIMLSEQEQ